MEKDADWMDTPGKARRKGKDSVFLDLFGIPRYGAQMADALHPELAVTEQDIEYVSLHSVLMVKPYNDMGILVKGRLLVCTEAQSTWSLNVLVRLFLYLAETYHRYIQRHKELNIYGTKKISLPVPSCTVIYTGEDKQRPDFLSLAEEFFGKDSPLDLRVRVIWQPGRENIIRQYIRFCHVFNQQVHLHGLTGLAIEETIRICQNEDVLADYLGERKREVRDIMMTLFDQEEVTKRYGYEMKEEGRAEGRAERDVLSIRNLMETMGLTMEKAMDALKIPIQDRDRYAAALRS